MQPIMDVTSNDLICNGGINPYALPISNSVVNVPAGYVPALHIWFFMV
jgi:cellulase